MAECNGPQGLCNNDGSSNTSQLELAFHITPEVRITWCY